MYSDYFIDSYYTTYCSLVFLFYSLNMEIYCTNLNYFIQYYSLGLSFYLFTPHSTSKRSNAYISSSQGPLKYGFVLYSKRNNRTYYFEFIYLLPNKPILQKPMEHNRREHSKLKKQPPFTFKFPFKASNNRLKMRNYVSNKRSGNILH